MKKILFAFLFVFCLTATFGGLFLPQTAYAAEEGSVDRVDVSKPISNKEDFISLVNGYSRYSSTYQNAQISLGASLDLGGAVLTGTIGMIDAPFAGTFNGNSFVVSNFVLQPEVASEQYCGLFGVTDGATIQNLELYNVKINSSASAIAYAGALVGKATGNTVIEYCQVDGRVQFESSMKGNVSFGGIAGFALNSKIENCIVRSSDFGNWALEEGNNICAFGGVVGRVSSSRVLLCAVEANFNLNISNAFKGSVALGGAAGKVTGGGSFVRNIAIENNYNILSSQNLMLGEAIAEITGAHPNEDNLCNIHFKNNGYMAVADGFAYDASKAQITVNKSSQNLSEIIANDVLYFKQNDWHSENPWNFDEVWYVNSGTNKLSLQSFQNNFVIRVANSNPSVINFDNSTLASGYKFNESVVLKFNFAENMEKYYRASSIVFGNKEIAVINVSEDGVYSLSSDDGKVLNRYLIANNGNGFDLTIKNINMATSGSVYSINITPKEFSGKIESVVYGEDNNVLESADNPYVYTENNATNQDEMLLNKIRYGSSYTLSTKAKPGTPYAFVGWYLQKQDGSLKQISQEKVVPSLAFKFGEGDFVDDFTLLARYSVDACNVTFKMDEGIEKIVISEDFEHPILNSDQVRAVSKTDQALKMQIYVEKNYKFDVEEFIKELDIYKSQAPNTTFCSFIGREPQENGSTSFNFILDLTNLQPGTYSDSFTVNARTVKTQSEKSNFVWWIVAGVGGGVTLVAIIILVVWLIMRNRGFGGGSMGGGTKVSKKSFKKGMYY